MGNLFKINDNWIFLKGISEIPVSVPETGEWVSLPHTWNAIDGQDGGNDYFRGSCCYVKSISKSEMPQGQQYYLEINGANSSADVLVNGQKLAHHDGGYSIWRVNMTEVMKDENIIVIVVDNSPTDKVYPQTADFTFYGGLYRDVNIIAVNNTHFDLDYYGGRGMQITPVMDGDNAKISVKTYVTNMQAGDVIEYKLRDADGNIVAETVSTLFHFSQQMHLHYKGMGLFAHPTNEDFL